MSSWWVVWPAAPRTPKPPAFVTAATTSRQWLKASTGNSIPNSSHTLVRMARNLAWARRTPPPSDDVSC